MDIEKHDVQSRSDALRVVRYFKSHKICVVSCEILSDMDPGGRRRRVESEEPDLIRMMDVIRCSNPSILKSKGRFSRGGFSLCRWFCRSDSIQRYYKWFIRT